MLMEQFSAIHNQPIATKGNGYQGLDAELTINKTKFVDQVKFFKKMQDEKLFVVKTKQARHGHPARLHLADLPDVHVLNRQPRHRRQGHA